MPGDFKQPRSAIVLDPHEKQPIMIFCMIPTDLIRLVRELGPVWGVILGVLLAIYAVARYQWNQGSNSLPALLRDPTVITVTLALFGGLAIYLSLYLVLYERKRGLPRAFSGDEIGILVAEIPGDRDRKLQQTYVQAIRALAATVSELADQVRVRLIERPLPNDPDRQHQEAVQLGKRLKASFVLRAIQVEAGYQTWISIVDLPEFSKAEAHLGKVNERQLAELETLALPGQVTLLARCALAVSLYRRGMFEQAGNLLRQILEEPDLPEGSPPRPYLLQMLGNTFFSRRFSDPPSLLARAIATYDEALQLWTRERNPNDWADTMFNRGLAYFFLPGPDRIANLQEALRSADLALAVHTRHRNPERWARGMMLRGFAYADLPDPSKLQEAIHSLDSALQVFTREQFPYEWAMVMIARGRAHQHLETAEAAQETVRCYNLALKVFRREKYPIDWAQTIVNRASVFLSSPDLATDLEAEFEEAVGSLDFAEEVFTRDRFPVEWAGIKTLHGIFYFLLSLTDRTAGEEAIRSFDEALEVLSPERYPVQHARVMNSRGLAYALGEGPDSTARLREAIRAHGQAAALLEAQGFHSEAANARELLGDAEKKLAEINGGVEPPDSPS